MKNRRIKTIVIFPAIALMSLSSCSSTPTTYTITWKNEDGTILKVDKEVKQGDIPEYKGEEPKKEKDAQYTYTFSGWSPAIEPANADATYTACYSTAINKYTITWKNGDTVLKTESLDYGATPSYDGTIPTKAPDEENIYVFSKWEPAIEKVSKDATYSATFEAHSKALDDDYDGIPNGIDPEPQNNVFKNVKFKSMYQMTTDLQIDYRWFIERDNKVYHNDISKLGIFLEQNNAEFNDKVPGDLFVRMGCDDIVDINMKAEDYDANKNDLLGGKLAHHTIIYNNKKTDIVFIQILGTRNTDEWISNFDVGYDSEDYYSKAGIKTDTPDWGESIDKEYVKGFRCASNRFLKNNKQASTIEYVDNHTKNEGTPIIFVFGHSRGAAAAEIIGQYFESSYKTLDDRACKTFTYTYASPMVHDTATLDRVKSETVFNVINADDIVPMVPLEQWGLSRIGKDEVVTPVSKKLKEQYEKATGNTYYNLIDVEKILIKLIGNRNEIYKVDTEREVNLAYVDQVHTKDAVEYRIQDIKDKIQNDLKLSLDYFDFKVIEPQKEGEEYTIKVYNCKATLLALVTNVLKNVYDLKTWEDVYKLVTACVLVLNDVYTEAVLDFVNTTGIIGEDLSINTDTVAKPHDLCSYLVIVDNYQKV